MDELLLQIIILGELKDPQGHIWRVNKGSQYVIEKMTYIQTTGETRSTHAHDMITLVPCTVCRTPQECLQVTENAGMFIIYIVITIITTGLYFTMHN